MTGPRTVPAATGIVELAQKLRDEFAPKEVSSEDDKKRPGAKAGGLFQRR
jgi:hypothetical protein